MYLLYFILWVIFNGTITFEICWIGLIVSGAIFAFTCKFMDYSLKKEKKLFISLFKILRYLGIVIWEIIKANITAVKMIISEKEILEPVLVDFSVHLKTSTARALLANAITLTPGTITVTLEDNIFTVHCLDKSLAEGIDNSIFVECLTELEDIWLRED